MHVRVPLSCYAQATPGHLLPPCIESNTYVRCIQLDILHVVSVQPLHLGGYVRPQLAEIPGKGAIPFEKRLLCIVNLH